MTDLHGRKRGGRLDIAFDALGSHQRRRVLVALLDQNPQSPRVEGDGAGEAFGRREGERLSPAMYHNHLPKLDAQGFVRWDRDTHEIERGPRFEEIRPLLELLDSHATVLPGEWP
jgi:hypothetical protein